MTISPVAIALPQSSLTEDEERLVNEMLNRLAVYEVSNRLKEAYYEGEQRIHHLGIAIPPHLQNIPAVVGWAGMSVDILAERIDWQGWRSYEGDDFGLSEVYEQNSLDIESGLATKDAFIYGTSFLVVGSGFDGEPNPLITVESARNMTGIWDNRTRRLSAALGVNANTNGVVDDVTLYMPYANIRVVKVNGLWVVADRDQHNLGRVLVAQMVNDPRASRNGGRSQITRAIRYAVDTGVRTLLGMELNREFYSTPHRWAAGMEKDAFLDENGNPTPGWEALMTKMMVAPPNENGGPNPTFGQFTPASPAPYLDQIKGLAQMAASEMAAPVTYLGFHTDNPPSGDAARIMESRLIKRAEDRQSHFGRALTEVGRLALLVRDGEIPDEYSRVTNKWRDAGTPTRSAAADEVSKLVSSGILPADSEVVLDRIGLDPAEKAQVMNERRKANASQRLADLQAAVQGTEVA
ncbi:phage portal protein [Nocardioides abyssi]|uniref:Phage portal protein n=1 Tax=Nocardioides abyssi TaxID=3058370 RepID=A0ABT8EY38_9ACTN|nr:phage portal protein [Nocardioides abyssi]MDN4162948.1 phage portal protein [Nocardioides abyssi]